MNGSKRVAMILLIAGILCLQADTSAQSAFLVDAVATPRYVEVTVEIPPPSVIRTDRGDELVIDGFGRFGEPGTPDLPGRIFAVAVPPGAQVSGVTVTPLESSPLPARYDIPVVELPHLIGQRDRDLPPEERARYRSNLSRVYGADDPYPATAGHLVRTAGYRKYDLIDVCITPVSYRPRTRRVVHHSRIAIRVACSVPADTSFRPDDLAGPEEVAREIVLNHEQAQEWYTGAATAAGRGSSDFVIITLDSLVAAVQPLVDWETRKGRSVNVVTTTWIESHWRGYDLAEKMRNFLRDKYPSSAWGIEDVLLVGHYDDVPMRQTAQTTGYGMPETDFYYAELSKPDDQSWDKDGDHKWGENSDTIDLYNEVNVGRIPWSDPAVVEDVCRRSIAFESTNDPAYKKNILLLGAFLWADTDTAVLMEQKIDHRWMSDWTVTRLYEEGHTNYAMDHDLDFNNTWSTWSKDRFAFVNWAGHGSPMVSRIYYGYGFHWEHFVSRFTCTLLDEESASIIFALACSNADSNADNIGRAMIRRGAVGFLGANKPTWAEQGWDSPNDRGIASLDYRFTRYVTSGEFTQGQAQQKAFREMYTLGLWFYTKYETFVWGGLMGNPALGLAEVAPITLGFPAGLPEGCLRPGPATPLVLKIHDGVASYVPGSGLLHYRFDPAAPFSSLPLTFLGGDRYEATLPHTRAGDEPEFYFEARGDGGSTVCSPLDAPASVYSIDVAFVELLLEDDFESDTGWSVVNENIATGAWERVDPEGTVGQSEDDHTEEGSMCFVTGGDGGKASEYDVDGGPTRLISPTIDLSSGDANLSFHLWFRHSVLGVTEPLCIDLTNDDGASWMEIDQLFDDQGWTRMDYSVSDHVRPTSTMRVRLSVSDNPDDSTVEALVDDFRLERYDHAPSMWADAYEIPSATGGSVDLTLSAGSSQAGYPYMVLGSMSGSSPGFDFNGVHVPLNWDWFTVLTMMMAGSPQFADFQGRLDPSGEATAIYDTRGPVEPDLVGLGASFAYIALGPSGFVSNPITVQFEE